MPGEMSTLECLVPVTKCSATNKLFSLIPITIHHNTFREHNIKYFSGSGIRKMGKYLMNSITGNYNYNPNETKTQIVLSSASLSNLISPNSFLSVLVSIYSILISES